MHSDLCGVTEQRCILRGNLQSHTKDLLFQYLHVKALCRLHLSIQHNLPHETAAHATAGYWTLTQTDLIQFGWAATASTQHRSPPGLCAQPTPFHAVHRLLHSLTWKKLCCEGFRRTQPTSAGIQTMMRKCFLNVL